MQGEIENDPMRKAFDYLSESDYADLVRLMSGAKHEFFSQASAWGFTEGSAVAGIKQGTTRA